MLRQGLYHKLQQKLSPQQIQLMKLLQVPTVELEQRIKQEMEENPALEEGDDHDDEEQPIEEQATDNGDDAEGDDRDDFDLSDYYQDDDTPDYKLTVKNTGPDEEDREMPLAGGTTFQDSMRAQLGLRDIDEREALLAEHLIGNLDEDGYLRRDLDAIVNDLAFTQNMMTTKAELEKALKVVQTLDPAGVGARDLRECLMLQLERLPHAVDVRTAQEIIGKHFEAFTKKHYDRILERIEIDEEALKEAIDVITHLNPKPGNTARDTSKPVQEIIPDFQVNTIEGQLELMINGRNAPELRISRQYREMIKEYQRNKKDKDAKEALVFIKQKLDAAKWFIDAIKQRQVEADDPEGHRREGGAGHQHHQPRGQQQIRADQLRHHLPEVLLQREPHQRGRRRGEHPRGEEDPEGRDRGRGEAQTPHRRPAHRAAEGEGLQHRPPHRGQVPRTAECTGGPVEEGALKSGKPISG
jgi:RNA polymerase sigma-54 factor